MSLNIAIIDDEPAARAALQRMLQRQADPVQLLGEAGGVEEGLALLNRKIPDLLLLDVEMEDGTGFDLLDRLAEIPFNVVFCTAHDEFAIRAFRYNAIDYLLKPILPEELEAAINKARAQKDYPLWQRQIADLLHTNHTKTFDRIILPTGDGPVFAQTRDIVHLESYGNYTFVFLSTNERILASRNLKEFEEMLPSTLFFRTHQSHIVQVPFVKQLLKNPEGDVALLQTGSLVPVARRKKDAFKSLLHI
jgi:two-component system LytT family response regulator